MFSKIYFLCCFWFTCLVSQAQLFDTFSDGEFLKDPQWKGDTSSFIINDNLQLQSNRFEANSTFYLSTPNHLANEAMWQFYVQMDFNPSSANYIDVWLIADEEQLTAANNSGYFVRIGNTSDNICLYKKDKNGKEIKLIEGRQGLLNRSANRLVVKVIRTAGKFILLCDASGAGQTFRSEGSFFDEAIQYANAFGIIIRQSTSSFFQKHFFDDFLIKDFIKSKEPLNISKVLAIDAHTLEIVFSEIIQPQTISAANFFSSHDGFADAIEIDVLDGRIVRAHFDAPFKSDQNYLLTISSVAGIFDDAVFDMQHSFLYHKPMPYDVVINEIFADPQPQVGLPAQKFFELKNVSAFPIQLKNWTVGDGNNFGVLPSILLEPDSFLIVCPSSGLNNYLPFGNAIALSPFPTLLVAGGTIILYDDAMAVIHAAEYNLSTYKHDQKKDGGYSLELINPQYACIGEENWKASADPIGGTPGRQNSVHSTEPLHYDVKPLAAYIRGPGELILQFTHGLDSANAVQSAQLRIEPEIKMVGATVMPPFFKTLKLDLETDLLSDIIYTIYFKNLKDCTGEGIDSGSLRFGISAAPKERDIVINEILFNPKKDGVDYVELYNNSKKLIDLSELFIANRSSTGILGAMQKISTDGRLLFPEEILLISADKKIVQSQYFSPDPKVFIDVKTMPSFPNEKGTVVILNSVSEIIDEVNYSAGWHSPMIKDPKGVSLERMRLDGPSDQSNFHSASSTVGYGTPGYKNSQGNSPTFTEEEITVFPKVFSPDGDGIDDRLTIEYHFASPGFITNIRIFDAIGKEVCHLQKNALSGRSGFFYWDGTDNKGQKLPQGAYLLVIECFSKEGFTKKIKKSVVLARKR